MLRKFPNMPDSIKALPRDKRGFPVPAFVHWMDGEPDFRILNPEFFRKAYTQHCCWICGEPIGRDKTFSFVLGPMCAVNRVNSEPPSHNACAVFAALNCPFLSKPLARRNDKGLPETKDIAGVHIDRNPGCCLVWQTDRYSPMKVDNGLLFQVGPPTRIDAFAKGRRANRAEVAESVRTGLPFLEQAAEQDGPLAVLDLYRQAEAAEMLFDQWVKPARRAA
ncbi:MAG TPA: hypothetical protein VK602_00425 [Phyllobacterium sp.]|nr:hypothetical protein [Phyllobacterium sp.]